MKKNALLLCLLISGCAVDNPYRAPIEKPIANLLISVNYKGLTSLNDTNFWVHDSVMCRTNENGALLAYFGLFNDISKPAEKVIEANRDFVFTASFYGGGGKYLPNQKCKITNIFLPLPNKTYRVNFETTNENCSLQVFEVLSRRPHKEVGVKTEKLLEPCPVKDVHPDF